MLLPIFLSKILSANHINFSLHLGFKPFFKEFDYNPLKKLIGVCIV